MSVNDVPQADPVETAIPAEGYTIPPPADIILNPLDVMEPKEIFVPADTVISVPVSDNKFTAEEFPETVRFVPAPETVCQEPSPRKKVEADGVPVIAEPKYATFAAAMVVPQAEPVVCTNPEPDG